MNKRGLRLSARVVRSVWVHEKTMDYHSKPSSRVRSVSDALKRAKTLRKELPLVVQVTASDWDRVILADEIFRQRILLATAKRELIRLGACDNDATLGQNVVVKSL